MSVMWYSMLSKIRMLSKIHPYVCVLSMYVCMSVMYFVHTKDSMNYMIYHKNF